MPKKIMEGNVVSTKTDKTAVVVVEKAFRHPRYQKLVRRHKKYLTYDEFGVSPGDRVCIEETTPMSKKKKFKIVKVLTGDGL